MSEEKGKLTDELRKVVDRQAIALERILRIAEDNRDVDPAFGTIEALSTPKSAYRGYWCDQCSQITTHKHRKCIACGT